ncbi:MAG: hypothetical protein MRQ09_05870 [Candidatus Midichloria sp.]|nr:hypothetical protein [Candidatus Midichloria sp.]
MNKVLDKDDIKNWVDETRDEINDKLKEVSEWLDQTSTTIKFEIPDQLQKEFQEIRDEVGGGVK